MRSIGAAGFALVLLFPQVVPQEARVPVVAGASLAALVVAVLLQRSWRLTLVVGSFCVCVSIGWLRSGPSLSALAHFSGASLGLLLMGVVGAWGRTQGRLLSACGALLIVGTVATVVGLLGANPTGQKLFQQESISLGLPGLRLGVAGLEADGYVNRNALGGLVLMVIPLGLMLVRSGLHRAIGWVWPAVGLVGTIVGGYALVYSQSRSASFAAWVLVIVIATRASASWRVRLSAAACIVLVTAGAGVGLRQMQPGFFARAMEDAGASFDNRLYIFDQALWGVREAPWFGIGLNEFRHRYVPVPAPSSQPIVGSAHAHNVFLQTALDIGLVGLALYVVLVVTLLAWADRAAKRGPPLVAYTAAGAGLGLLGTHVFGVTDALALGSKVGVLQWGLCGLIVVAHELLERPVDTVIDEVLAEPQDESERSAKIPSSAVVV